MLRLEVATTLLSLGSRAVLAVPIVIFDELIGVLALHRNTPDDGATRRSR